MSKSHEIIIEVLNKMVEERMNTRRKYNRKLRKLEFQPMFLCYRTGELFYFLINHPLIKGNNEVIELLQECFHTCTRNTFRYIHLSDLINIIINHDKYNEWAIDLKY